MSCSVGMICEGMEKRLVQQGFAWDGRTGAFRCTRNSARCPGGEPGTCAEARDNTSIACSDCLPGMAPLGTGRCQACGGAEYGLLPGVATLLAVLLIALYVFIYRLDRTKQGYGVVLSGVTLSQMATLLQQSGVIAQMSMDGQDFIASTLQCMRQFAFEIEALNLGCTAEFIPTMQYILRNLSSVGFIVFLCLIHCTAVIVCQRKGRLGTGWRCLQLQQAHLFWPATCPCSPP